MADIDLNDYQIVLNKVESELPGFTHDTVQVTWTATMKNGSLLVADGTEAAAADAADVVGVIDDLTARNLAGELEVDDVLEVAVAKRGCVFNEDKVVFTDGAINATAKAALEGNMNTFSTVKSA
jgi:hypothetical protein